MKHDKAIFDEPKGWQNKIVKESPLLNDFDMHWNKLKGIYTTELSALAYTPIPDEKEVAQQFKDLIKLIQ
jgi:hypothetical protein